MTTYCVYILASRPRGTLYVDVTADLNKRIWEHKNKVVPGFTAKYGVDRLVHFEVLDDLESARIRERRLKRWNRSWKIELIETSNPRWTDLYPVLRVSVFRQNGPPIKSGECSLF